MILDSNKAASSFQNSFPFDFVRLLPTNFERKVPCTTQVYCIDILVQKGES